MWETNILTKKVLRRILGNFDCQCSGRKKMLFNRFKYYFNEGSICWDMSGVQGTKSGETVTMELARAESHDHTWSGEPLTTPNQCHHTEKKPCAELKKGSKKVGKGNKNPVIFLILLFLWPLPLSHRCQNRGEQSTGFSIWGQPLEYWEGREGQRLNPEEKKNVQHRTSCNFRKIWTSRHTCWQNSSRRKEKLCLYTDSLKHSVVTASFLSLCCNRQFPEKISPRPSLNKAATVMGMGWQSLWSERSPNHENSEGWAS